MPLPPLPDNNTDVAWLGYTSYGVQHELVFRQPSATPQADIVANAAALAQALKWGLLPTDSFNYLKHRDSGSNVSFPLSWTAVAGTYTGAYDLQGKALFIALSGRSLGGYRCRITFFTVTLADVLGYRQQVSAGAPASTFYNAVQAMEPAAVAIDGEPVIWNSYANMGFNAYWQRKSRG